MALVALRVLVARVTFLAVLLAVLVVLVAPLYKSNTLQPSQALGLL